MEFKSSRKKKVNFSNPEPRVITPAKKLKWFEDDDEWLDLVHKVKNEKSDKKSQSKVKKLFSKKESAFDDPTRVIPKKGVKIVEKTKTHTRKIKKISSTKSLKNKKSIVFIGVLLLVLTGLLVNKFIFNNNNVKDVAGTSVVTPKTGDDLPREKPSFKILYPGNKNEETIGEIVKNSPPGNAPVYNYPDNINGIKISVSQQELPGNFKINQDGELQKLAESFQANNVIQVDSIKVYHGSSASGVQSLVFIKGNLLILIAASQRLSDETWAAYISALHT